MIDDQLEVGVDLHQHPDDAIDRLAVKGRLGSLPHASMVARIRLHRKMAVSDYAVAGAAASARSNTSSPSAASTRTVSPSANRPSSSSSASGFSTSRWIARFSGRAP